MQIIPQSSYPPSLCPFLQNILLSEASPRAVIKFADFGFAKHLVEASMAQTPCGTPLYMVTLLELLYFF
jgi:hypothetical protein